MKKIILIFIAVLLLTSCTQTESSGNSSSVINGTAPEENTEAETTNSIADETADIETKKEIPPEPAVSADEKAEPEKEAEPEAEEPQSVPVIEEAEPEPEPVVEEISDLNGLWLQTGYENKDTYMIALVDVDYLKIMWFMDNGETVMMYWEGTFEEPTSPGNYEWESQNTLEGFHLMASDAESKIFNYTDGDIVYDMTMLGETATIHMVPAPEEMYLQIADVMRNYDDSEDSAPEVTVSETLLLDESGIKITATGLDTDAFMGPELKLLIENNTDKNLTVQTRSASVNGYMVDTSISEDVAAGKKANSEITFLSADIKRSGIDTIADMEFSFHIYDADWNTYLDTNQISVTTSAAEGYTYTYDDSGEVLYDAGGIKITARGISDEFLGKDMLIYIHNGTDKSITVQARDTSVNGFMLSPSLSEEVTPGKHSVAGMTFFSSELEENSISEITEVETSFHIFDSDTWETIVDTDPITIKY